MPSYNVTLYKNTGFNKQNIPDSPDLVALAGDSVTVPSVFLYQNYDLARIRVDCDWDTVRDVDYCQINAVWYFVLGATMLTHDTTCELSLSMDYITTAGGFSQLGITDGWVKRAHTADDALFNNILNEPWSPSEDLVIDGNMSMPSDVAFFMIPVVGATVDLEQTEYTAREYKNGSGEVVVSVPEVPTIVAGTTIQMRFSSTDTRSYQMPNLRLFDLTNISIYNGIQAVRSLGLEDAITASYLLPSIAVETFNVQGAAYQYINGAMIEYAAALLPFRYISGWPVQNNKVFAMNNRYTALSICSGDQNSWDAHELYVDGAASPTFRYTADCSPNGKPYLQPTSYKGAATTPFMHSIQGLNWQNTPINFGSQKSGSLLDNVAYERSRNRDIVNAGFDTAIGTAELVSAGAKAASADFGGLFTGENTVSRVADATATGLQVAQNATNTLLDFRENYADYLQNQRVNVPEIRFPIAEGVQNFIGNNFRVYRTRLGNNDVQKLDRFFTMFGYAQDKPLEMTDFTNRQYFNYVQAEGVNVTANLGLRHRAGVCAALAGGLRVWHVPVNTVHYNSNPIKVQEG